MTAFIAICWSVALLGALVWAAEKLYNLPLRLRLLRLQVEKLEQERKGRL